MAVKLVEVPGVGKVALYRRKGVRTVRLSITHDGTVRVTLPPWAPYRLGIEFVRNKTDWIDEKRVPMRLIENGDRVGKAHRFLFISNINLTKPSSRLSGTDIKISLSAGVKTDSSTIQNLAERTAVKALKKEAEQLLPQRLAFLATKHGFVYNSVSIKRLKSRWGSCNERKDIVLNCFLMQLPWHLIDYVLMHELVHTRVLRHGAPFWSELSVYINNLPAIRKEMKAHQAMLKTTPLPFKGDSGATPLQLAVESY